jgi:hypothetical protein
VTEALNDVVEDFQLRQRFQIKCPINCIAFRLRYPWLGWALYRSQSGQMIGILSPPSHGPGSSVNQKLIYLCSRTPSLPAQPKTSITTTTQILRQAETRKPRTVLGLACCSGRRRPVPAVAKRQDRRKEIKSGLLTLEELSKSYAFPAIIVWQA